MKYKIKQILYFIEWLFYDFIKFIKELGFWWVYHSILIFLMIVSCVMPIPEAFYTLYAVLIGLSFTAIYWGFYMPIKFKYNQFKSEQQKTFDTIKNSN